MSATASTSTAPLIRRTYAAFAQGDVPALIEVLADDVAWHVPGRHPLSGDYAGHDGVLGLFAALGRRCDTFTIEIHDLLDSDDGKAVALVTEHATRNATELASSSVHVWYVDDGQVTGFAAYHGDDHETDLFWS